MKMLPGFTGGGRFELLAKLGEGGMGTVYEAFDREHGSRVALKTFRRDSPEALFRLKNEFRALQGIHHPNLVSIGELLEEDGIWFFTMELLKGTDFVSYVRRRDEIIHGILKSAPDELVIDGRSSRAIDGDSLGLAETLASPLGIDVAMCVHDTAVDLCAKPAPSMDPSGEKAQKFSARNQAARSEQETNASNVDLRRLRKSLVQVCQGLIALHQAGQVHRDIEPSNVMVTQDGRVVLLDFGLVTPMDPSEQSTEHLYPLGTVAYMAPEQAAVEQSAPAADWYSVGVMLFEALTGRLPFEGPPLRIMLDKQQGSMPKALDLVSNLPEDLVSLCEDLMQVEPEQRPAGSEVLQRLQAGPKLASTTPKPSLMQKNARFVGREFELDRLSIALARTKDRQPAYVLLHGSSGFGKSELLRTFLQRSKLSHERLLSLSGRCYESETVPFKAFDGVVDSLSRTLRQLPRDEALRAVPRNAGLLSRVFPVLGRIDFLGAGHVLCDSLEDLQEFRFRAFRALREMLGHLAERFLLAITLDDLQWADEDSWRLMRVLTEPPESPPICWLCAVRVPSDRDAAEASLREILEHCPVGPELIPVGPLSTGEGLSLARALLSDADGEIEALGVSASTRRLALDEPLAGHVEKVEIGRAQAIHEEAGGHPMFIQELARYAHLIRSKVGNPTVLLDEALWERVRALEQNDRVLVEQVCLASVPIPMQVAADAAGLAPATLQQTVARLKIENILRTHGPRLADAVEPFHDRVRESVLSRLSDDALQAGHAALARALIGTGQAEPELISRHLEGAGDLELAAHYAELAADQSTQALAFDLAARLYRRALVLRGSHDQRMPSEHDRDLWMRLGEALANAGRGGEAAESLLRAIPGARSDTVLAIQCRVADQLLRSGRVQLGMDMSARVCRAVGLRLPQTPKGALLSFLWQRAKLRLRGMRFVARDERAISSEQMVRIDICEALAKGMAVQDHVLGALFSTRFLLEALRAGVTNRVLTSLSLETAYIATNGFGGGRYHNKIMSFIETVGNAHNNPNVEVYLKGAAAYSTFQQGDFSGAKTLAEDAVYTFQQQSVIHWETALVRFIVCWSDFYLGNVGTLSARVPGLAYETLDRGDFFGSTVYRSGLAIVAYLNAFGHQRAVDVLNEVVTRLDTRRYHLQNYYILLARNLAGLYAGDAAVVLERFEKDWRSLRRSLLHVIPSVRCESYYYRAGATLMTIGESNMSERKHLLRRCQRDARVLARRGLPWTNALSRQTDAAVAFHFGDLDLAVQKMQSVIAILEDLDMVLHAAATRMYLGRILKGDEGRRLVEGSLQVMRERGVQEPERMKLIYAPGFSDG